MFEGPVSPGAQERSCQPCPNNDSCVDCKFRPAEGQVVCLECKAGMMLTMNQCSIGCSGGEYAVQQLNANTGKNEQKCFPCPNNCKSCAMLALTQQFLCYECKQGYILNVTSNGNNKDNTGANDPNKNQNQY